jgi:1-acyl-sn-glycerol-3-phosphate acyltransferase
MIRGILVLPLVLLWTLISGLIGLLLRIAFPAEKCVYWVAHFLWSPVVFQLYGIKIHLTQKQELPQESAIYIANHSSQLDIAVVVKVIAKGLFFVAKKELSKVPFLGQYMTVMGMIFVDRGNRERAIQSMNEAAAKVVAGKNLVTFPEGTRSKDEVFTSFKKGSFVIAQKSNIPIVPIVIKGASKALVKGSFIGRSTDIHVCIGEAIYPNQYPNHNPGELAQLAQEKMQSIYDLL